MSIYGNVYVKKNKECSLVINAVAGSEFHMVELEFIGDFPRHRNLTFLINSFDGYKLAKLLATKTIGNESQGMDNFYAGKVDSFEYFDNTILQSDKELLAIIHATQNKRFESMPTDELMSIKDREEETLKLINNVLKKRSDK
jgi:hypothetical protein